MENQQSFSGHGKGKISCPVCGTDVTGKIKGTHVYGNPFRTCEGCGNTYYDERYHEICTDGILFTDELPVPFWKVIGTLTGLVILLFALSGWCSWFFGLSAMWALGAIGFLVLVLFLGLDLAELSAYRTRKKRLKKLELESVNRIRDPKHVQRLEEKGKYVLGKYEAFTREQEPVETEK